MKPIIQPLNMKSTDFELAARASLVALEAGVADASHLVNCYVLADMAHRLGGEDYVLTHGYNIKRLCDEIFAQDYKARPLQVAAMRASVDTLIRWLYLQNNHKIHKAAMDAVKELS